MLVSISLYVLFLFLLHAIKEELNYLWVGTIFTRILGEFRDREHAFFIPHSQGQASLLPMTKDLAPHAQHLFL